MKQYPGIFLIFQKKTLENAGSEEEIVNNSHSYKVNGEVGRFEFSTHSAIDRKAGIQFNTADHLFPVLKARGFYRTTGFKELAFIHGNTENSFRKTDFSFLLMVTPH